MSAQANWHSTGAHCQARGLLGRKHHASVFTQAWLYRRKKRKVGDKCRLTSPFRSRASRTSTTSRDVEKALHELLASAPTKRCARCTRRWCASAASASPSSPRRCRRWTRLFDELPNFTEVLEDIRKHLALCIDSNDSVELPPMLLLGEPGIGKTHFARKVAAAARHRLRLRADELAHRRLGAVGRLLAVEERQARQGVRHLPERRLCQPGDRGRRDRQGERRRAVRPARRALRAARDRDRDALHRRVRRAADRRLRRGLARDRQRRRRASPSRCSTA